MAFSGFLDSKRGACRALVAELRRSFAYVSILGTDVRATMFHTNRRSSAICDGEGECGFVVRMHNGRAFFEYSLDDITGDPTVLADRIRAAVAADPSLNERMIVCAVPDDQPLKQDFVRESDFSDYADGDLLSFCTGAAR